MPEDAPQILAYRTLRTWSATLEMPVLRRPAKFSEVIAADAHVLLELDLDAGQILLGSGCLDAGKVGFCFVRHGFVPPCVLFSGAFPLSVTVYYRHGRDIASG